MDDRTIEFNRLVRSFIYLNKKDVFEALYFFRLESDFILKIDEIKNNHDIRFVNKIKMIHFPYHDDSKINSLFLRMFGIMKGYHYHKYNYDNFEAIVDDLIYPEYMQIEKISLETFKCFKKVVSEILCNRNYKELLGHREFLRNMCFSFGQENELDFIKIYNEKKVVFKDAEELDIDFKHAQDIFDKLIVPYHYANRESYFCKELFYDKILLFSDRFEFFNSKLQDIEKNYFIRKDIFSIVRKFSIGLFNELNVDNNTDSFKTCINCVFDSDSYLELRNKLNLLVEASNLYESGKKENAFCLVKKINDYDLKKKYKGKLVCYSSNTMNKISKPDTVLKREINLCSKIGHSNDFYNAESIVLYGRTLNDAIKWFNQARNPLILPINKLKCKLMKK